MIPELGHFALILALCLACFQAFLPVLGSFLKRSQWMAVAKPAAMGQAIFVTLAFLALAWAFAQNDFSVLYVAQNSNTHLPLFYRVCAVWGAHEGSLLLWMQILACWTLAVCFFSKNLPRDMLAQVLSVMGMISVGFLLFSLSTSDPFIRLLPSIPSNGADLNPLLQDPGFIFHPPMLYIGYVGFSVAFAFAIAGLWRGELNTQWVRWTRPWTLIAWGFLSAGITLGSWWSYRELGWGGWWFWDPVENASFMPWLMGVALIHSLSATEKRGCFKSWTVLLAIFAFSLSLLGTFLVRSGILISVHAFAVDPARGAYMLKFLSIVILGSLLLYAWRARALEDNATFQFISRETFLLLNNIMLTTACATVLLGTLYPLILEALNLGKISVGAPYFNLVFIPIMLVMMFFMSLAPHAHWQNQSLRDLMQKIRWPMLSALLLGFSLPLVIFHQFYFWLSVGLFFAFWVINAVIFTTLAKVRAIKKGVRGFMQLPLAHYGMVLGHIGLGVAAIGIILVSNFSIERTLSLVPGETAQLGDYYFHFVNVTTVPGSTYQAAEAKLIVTKHHSTFTQIVYPQKRYYPVREMALSKVAIAVNPWRDIYVALGSAIPNSSAWSFRLYYKPFVRWIWTGGLLILIGGLFAAFDKRYRRKKNHDQLTQWQLQESLT
ncbi:MAG: heme lyase CcmF/NrfE family subunit [Legionellales bacterium]|nr:heme lyase CcmF/NrfE family subunit [Legionellales bacterium]